ncbi:bifunctional 3,4-dihydroxy-2-butanone-4-phosphate synthase/GTP cyclohydrolase II [Dactylosporangium sp. CA-139066]|uniref:bifunctional 3,4-dihydroxy-2-butanone-4-phosphate synthase/GTP cyclohydrolase II n=1 Tax=Dactylosporangium sp. CA-139066 TaxID=3239930 RepID=UPI003D8BFADA
MTRLHVSWDAQARRVAEAVEALRSGRFVVVLDDPAREGEGDLIMAAEHVTPERMAYLLRHSSGIVCVAADGELLDRLGLPPMTTHSQDRHGTAFTVSVDAAVGVTTGISATDRARTVRLLASPDATPADLARPGHVFPLRARPGGVLARRGHTEAGVDLMRLAGLRHAAVLCELTEDDGSVANREGVLALAERDGLPVVTVEDLVAVRRRSGRLVERRCEARLPTAHGPFRAVSYVSTLTGIEHLALVLGDVEAGDGVLARLHSECLTGDVLGSSRCDCGSQLDAALQRIQAAGRGVLVYQRGHEGRGIGLAGKIAAYALQDGGMDTVEANIALGHPADVRDFAEGVQILADLGVRSVRLMTNSPDKIAAFEGHPVAVEERVPLTVGVNPDNLAYLLTKQTRMGHLGEVRADGTAPLQWVAVGAAG